MSEERKKFQKPVFYTDYDGVINAPDYIKYGNIFNRNFSKQTRTPIDLIQRVRKRIVERHPIGWELNGKVVTLACDAYSYNAVIGKNLINILRNEFQHTTLGNKFQLPAAKEEDAFLGSLYRRCRQETKAPFVHGAQKFLQRMLDLEENGELFFCIFSNEAPLVKEELTYLDPSIAKKIKTYPKGGIIIDDTYTYSVSGREIPDTIPQNNPHWELHLRRPFVDKSLHQMARDAYSIQPDEKIDLSTMNIIGLDDSPDMLALPHYLGATAILFHYKIFYERDWIHTHNSGKYYVESLQGATFLIYNLIQKTPDLHNIATTNLLIDALEQEYTTHNIWMQRFLMNTYVAKYMENNHSLLFFLQALEQKGFPSFDQKPRFKALFERDFIPELRRRGKIVEREDHKKDEQEQRKQIVIENISTYRNTDFPDDFYHI